MTLTPSTMRELGTEAPDFELPDVVTGETVRRDDFADKKGLLVMFICRHCPYVQHIKEGLTALGKDYADEDVGIVAISSNDADEYPDDSPESLREFAEDNDFEFPLLYDESQEVAKAYTAACTPDFFLHDENRELVYRGQFDDSRPDNDVPVTGEDLREAIDAVIDDGTVPQIQSPSAGCNIKWKPGNEPDYFG